MTLHAMLVVGVRLAAGYLADLVMKRRGHGMTCDALFGIGGSFVVHRLFLAARPRSI